MVIPYLYQEIEQIYAKTIGKGARTLTVTSSIVEEGTSSIVCALAQRAMAVNFKVLVVDLNLHNPCVSHMINSDSQTMVIENGPEIPVIPVPVSDDTQIRMREQKMLNEMIVNWLADYELIIFDTSPLCLVNRRNIPAQLVAACCDGAVLVVQSDKTQISQLTEAMAILQSVNVNLLGTVVNDYANPCLGVELVRQCCKLGRRFPKLADWLIERINGCPFLFARF
jgi:protein-tyrosine kinase